MSKLLKIHTLILLFILIIGGLLRFYKLDWGQGYFFHPDEYHIVISVNQLSFPTQMHPHFFSYGTVTIYLIYFTQVFFDLLSSFSHYTFYIIHSTFPFLIGRFYSALFSTLTILIVFKIGQIIFKKDAWAILAAFLVALTPGLIQQAHFATPESTLIFFIITSLYFLLQLHQHQKTKYLIYAAIFFGLSLGVKISSLSFLPVIFATVILTFSGFRKVVLLVTFSLLISAVTLAVVAPFIFLDFSSFKSNLFYEGSLAAGQIMVFYTRQFIETTPILFQLQKIYPVTLGPALLFLGILGFFLMLFSFIKKPLSLKTEVLLLMAFLLLFIPNAFLFAKWTRFISLTFPFFAIFTTYFLFKISQLKLQRSLSVILHFTFYIINLVWFLVFLSIYLKDDVRITASNWLINNIPSQSVILVEGGNVLDLPLSGFQERISLDFYSYETSPQVRQQVSLALEKADYFIIESRRVFLNHQRLPEIYPQTARFYNDLFTGNLGFKQVKEFHSYPTIPILNIEFPDEQAEETWSVFDHPVIRIFQKVT